MSRRSTHSTRRALGLVFLCALVVLLVGPSAASTCCGPRPGDVYRSLAAPMPRYESQVADTVSPPVRQRSTIRIDSLRAIAKCWRYLHAPRSSIPFAAVQLAIACPDSATASKQLVQYGPMYRYGEDGQVHTMIAVGDTMTLAATMVHGRLFIAPRGLAPYRADLASPSPVPSKDD